MSRPVQIQVEQTRAGCWTYVQRSAGSLPETPLHQLLKWIIEQLNFGNFTATKDGRGDVVSLTLGRSAAAQRESADAALAETHDRLLAVSLAGLMAQSRESGIEPQHAGLSKAASQQITDWGRRNTEFHYATELLKTLGRLNKKTFNPEAPPITGLAPASVIAYLRESTRCWLYGFHGASVALSRACLEETLRTKLPTSKATAIPATLEYLVDRAKQQALLDDCMAETAHSIRKVGNRFIHGESITERESRDTLDAIRSIVEVVFIS